MKRIQILFIILSYFCFIFIHAEDNLILSRSMEHLRVESPNEASFNKYIDHPIDMYNGTPDISIPIYSLIENQINISIALRYNSSGIKLDEEAGWVGLGWNLNAGGVITRSVIGGIDKVQINQNTAIDYYANAMQIMEVDKFENDDYTKGPWSQNTRDAFDWYLTEPSKRKVLDEGRFDPDIFYYSYPGGSGKFIINYIKKEVIILEPKDNSKIEPVLGSVHDYKGELFDSQGHFLVGFKIITPEGIIHKFDFKNSTFQGNPGIMQKTGETYLLVKSEYPNGQTVNYEYESKVLVKFGFQQSLKSYMPSTVNRVSHPLVLQAIGSFYNPESEMNGSLNESSYKAYIYQNITQFFGEEFYLSKIETQSNLITFKMSNRDDMPDALKLDSVIINPKNIQESKTKAIAFKYDYFTNYNSSEHSWLEEKRELGHWTEDMFSRRLKLGSVETIDKNQSINKYNFYYNSNPLPRKDSYAVDYWGYYNGQIENETFIPEYDYLCYHDFFGDFISKIRTIYKNNFNLKKAANRAYDFESAKSCMLEGIEYPTGGYTEFIYEPHIFVYDYVIPNKKEVKAGIPAEKISLFDDNSFFAPSDTYPSQRSRYFTLEKEGNLKIVVSLRRGAQSWAEMANTKVYINRGGNNMDLSQEIKTWCYTQHINETQYGKTPVKSKLFEFIVNLPKSSGYFIIDLPDDFGDQSKYLYDQGARVELGITIPKAYLNEKDESEGGGIRIKEICSYESRNKAEKLLHTKYVYVNPETGQSSGVLHIYPKMHSEYKNVHDVLGRGEAQINPYSTCDFYYLFGAVRLDKIEITKDIVETNPYQSSNNVAYSFVSKMNIDNKDSVYNTIHKFHNECPKRMDLTPQLNDPLNGRQTEILYLNRNNDTIKQERFNYSKQILHYNSGFTFYDPLTTMRDVLNNSDLMYFELSPKDFLIVECISQGMYKTSRLIYDQDYENVFLKFDRLRMIQYPINSYAVTLDSREILQDGVSYKEYYIYNRKTLQLLSKTFQNRSGDIMNYSYVYPNDFNCGIYEIMTNRNMTSKSIEEKIYRNNKYLGGRITKYGYFKNEKIFPSIIYLSEGKGNQTDPGTFTCSGVNESVFPHETMVYKEYDSYGNPIHVIENGSNYIVYLWSYNGQYPIAEIKNVTYEQVKSALGFTSDTEIDALSASAVPDVNSIRTKLDNYFKNTTVTVTSYTYCPLVGMLTATDPRGVTTYYEYDDFNRLKRTYIIENGVQKTVQSYDYHYRGQ